MVMRFDHVPIVIAGMMGAHRGRVSVLVMQATSKRNVRTECDERQAMNEASKHEVYHSKDQIDGGGIVCSWRFKVKRNRFKKPVSDATRLSL